MTISPLISAALAGVKILIPLANEATGAIKGATWGFKGDLRTLGRRLSTIEALLSDAENSPRKIESEVLKLWLKNLKLAICDAENVLDEVAYKSLRSKLEVRKRDKEAKREEEGAVSWRTLCNPVIDPFMLPPIELKKLEAFRDRETTALKKRGFWIVICSM